MKEKPQKKKQKIRSMYIVSVIHYSMDMIFFHLFLLSFAGLENLFFWHLSAPKMSGFVTFCTFYVNFTSFVLHIMKHLEINLLLIFMISMNTLLCCYSEQKIIINFIHFYCSKCMKVINIW